MMMIGRRHKISFFPHVILYDDSFLHLDLLKNPQKENLEPKKPPSSKKPTQKNRKVPSKDPPNQIEKYLSHRKNTYSISTKICKK